MKGAVLVWFVCPPWWCWWAGHSRGCLCSSYEKEVSSWLNWLRSLESSLELNIIFRPFFNINFIITTIALCLVLLCFPFTRLLCPLWRAPGGRRRLGHSCLFLSLRHSTNVWGEARERGAGFISSRTIQNSDGSKWDSVLVKFVHSGIATTTIHLFIESWFILRSASWGVSTFPRFWHPDPRSESCSSTPYEERIQSYNKGFLSGWCENLATSYSLISFFHITRPS